MKNSMKKFVFAAVAAVAFAAVAAHATTVSEVQAIVAGLKTKTAAVVITGKQAETKDRPGLTLKLDEAGLKLDQAKFCDSIQKLNDFKARVNQLAAAGKLNQDPAAGTTAQELIADAAIAGLNDLVTQSGTVCTF
jgi:opacity protein-like surface antigen